VQRRLNDDRSTLDELASLAVSAGYTVVGQLEQVRQSDPRFQIGSGKVKELANLAKTKEAEKVIKEKDGKLSKYTKGSTGSSLERISHRLTSY
jgi:50S ribosomal subunit-associated GTPase HflX